MKPTKTAWTKRTMAKKKPRKYTTKRAYDSKSVVGRLIKLKYKINTAYENGEYGPTPVGVDTTSDRDWVLGIIEEAKDGINPNQQHLLKANELWRKYAR